MNSDFMNQEKTFILKGKVRKLFPVYLVFRLDNCFIRERELTATGVFDWIDSSLSLLTYLKINNLNNICSCVVGGCSQSK